MANRVKIKRNKLLRFRLISLMYLIFIILAVIQIPTDWLTKTPRVVRYLQSAESNYQDASLATIANNFDGIFRELKLKLNYQEMDGQLPAPFSYNLVDQFFLKESKGAELFSLLVKLKEWHNLLPENDPSRKLFLELFEEDLTQGLKEENPEKWIEWRWQHVPATFAVSLMEELRLRLKLLSGMESQNDAEAKKKNLSLSSSFNEMVAGEETDFLINGDSILSVDVRLNDLPVNEFELAENHLRFRPLSAGNYTISIQGTTSKKEIQIRVKPRAVYNPPQRNIRVGYRYLPMVQYIDTDLKGLKLTCSTDPEASLNIGEKTIRFCPNQSGWCRINLLKDGRIFLSDSFLIKELPEPVITVAEAGNNRISIERLAKLGKLNLQIMHPSFQDGTFKCIGFALRLVGKKPIELESKNSEIQLNEELLTGKTHLIVHAISYQAGKGKYLFPNPIIIQLL